uniref:MASE4 domain-containing protein n=1 Tax=Elaeophora elaphi TaxID=1147741 RepID=A0A0R3RL51_9BILA
MTLLNVHMTEISGKFFDKPTLTQTQCAGFFLLAIYTLYYTITYKKQTFNRKFDQMLLSVSIFLGIMISTWSWIVTAKCYNYLKEHNNNSNAMVEERCLWR